MQCRSLPAVATIPSDDKLLIWADIYFLVRVKHVFWMLCIFVQSYYIKKHQLPKYLKGKKHWHLHRRHEIVAVRRTYWFFHFILQFSDNFFEIRLGLFFKSSPVFVELFVSKLFALIDCKSGFCASSWWELRRGGPIISGVSGAVWFVTEGLPKKRLFTCSPAHSLTCGSDPTQTSPSGTERESTFHF